jgi:hypothetical protein
MNNLKLLVLAVGITVSSGAIAEEMSKAQHQFIEQNLETEYTAAEAGCKAFAGNEHDICIAKARGNKLVAKAELEANYNPSVKTRYGASAAAAEANYSVAFEKCNANTGSVKEACVNQAVSARDDELAIAMKQLRDSKPDAASAKIMRNEVSPPQKPILRGI